MTTLSESVTNYNQFTELADYSFMNKLNADPQATENGQDFHPREVLSGHYVPVAPTPIADPEYISHSKALFKELGLEDELVRDEGFSKIFSGDLSAANTPMQKYGWATGYALSIYGTEYNSQCPFRTGNGYGDGRAISVFEGEFKGKRWEMQLKGGGPTPYCRGGDGRAVLRSSVREFLAQEFMHALGVPTSRSLTLYASKTETVRRPWYSERSRSHDPDVMVDNPVAISTRVAPSFLRVGQLELFSRRTISNAHPQALEELRMIVMHLIEREYKNDIDQSLPLGKQVVELAGLFRDRLTALVANWLRVGYCQGNFNSDNCAAGGYTLDYGPFGFIELFETEFQPWTGGGQHFSFFNQPNAAMANYHMFWKAVRPLLAECSDELAELDGIYQKFPAAMNEAVHKVWAAKLGLMSFDGELFQSLVELMLQTQVDYTIFFRELSFLPEDISPLKKSFYGDFKKELDDRWHAWLTRWRTQVLSRNSKGPAEISAQMKSVNPKFTWREWLVVPAYQKAMQGDYSLVRELQEVLSNPYQEQTKEIETKYYRLKPEEYFNAGGVSHYSCSS